MDKNAIDKQSKTRAADGSDALNRPPVAAYNVGPPAFNRVPACAYCKRLKVRCERGIPNDPSSPCLRCTRSNRECVMVNSKRKFPTDDQDPQSTQQYKRPHSDLQPNLMLRRTSIDINNVRQKLVSSWNILTERDNMRLRLLEKRPFPSFARPEDNVINQGLFTRKQVKQRLDLYRTNIWPVCPVVEAPEGENIEEMFQRTPVLMHTILDVASIVVRDPAQTEPSMILHNIVFRTVIDEYMIMSMKNIELLKSLVLLIHWYNESELYHQQRLRALTTLAVSLSYDLGLGGSMPPGCSSGKVPIFEQIVTPQVISDPYNTDYLNTWLSVYSFSFQETVANRRPIMSLWNSYTDEAVQRLEAEFAPTADRNIFHMWEFAKIRRISERITLELFKKGNEPRAPDYSNAAVQYLIHHFDVEISALEPEIGYESARRRISFLVVRAYLHQAVLYAEFDESVGRAPFTSFSLNFFSGPLTLQGAQSFATCFKSACEALKLVACLSPVQIACMVNSFWSSVVLCCDLVLKCRALCIFNRNYATACFISEADLSHVTRMMDVGDEVVNLYPNDNAAVSYMFLVKLIVCHHDARLHFLAGSPRRWNLGDTAYLQNMPLDLNEAVSQSGRVTSGEMLTGKPPIDPAQDGGGTLGGVQQVEGTPSPEQKRAAAIQQITGVENGPSSAITPPQQNGKGFNYPPTTNGDQVPPNGVSYPPQVVQHAPQVGMAPPLNVPVGQPANEPYPMQSYRLVPQMSPSQQVFMPGTASDDSPGYPLSTEEEPLMQQPVVAVEQLQDCGDPTQGGTSFLTPGDEYPLSNVDDFWRDFMNQSIGPIGTDFQI